MYRLHVHIKGVVQGVGFRPFVHALATRHALTGWVINDSRGVEIEAEHESKPELDSFLHALSAEAPPLADIVDLKWEITEIDKNERCAGFEIRESAQTAGERVLISPDVAVCSDCLREMYDPSDRRYRYPFLNCTNCGPRFTIIRDVPYDRPLTTMAQFEMCPDCKREYVDTADRRFHAQPTCCPVCGPGLEFLDAVGAPVDGDPIELTISMLRDGKTVAIKGIGGFHLACDAMNPDAVSRLRRNKHREAKPLAVMTGGISAARRLADCGQDAEKILLTPVRPIVILPEREGSSLPSGNKGGVWGVTGGLRTVGIMLPYAPIHHLLFRSLPIQPPIDKSKIAPPEEIGGPSGSQYDIFAALVMTSGNISDEPIAVDNSDALKRLAGIADGFLIHNRDIHRRCDDSVVALGSKGRQVWRIGRGYAPRPVFLNEPLPRVLGVGPEMRNNVCHIRDDKAFISPHVGDLKTFEAYEFFRETIAHQERILDVIPEHVACDLHPDLHSTRWAEESGLPLIRVQHHHAHVVALMAEHRLLDKRVLGLAMDGTGLGTDNTIWGGEILTCDPVSFERVGHFDYAPLPGGDAAVKEVWRAALGRLWSGKLPPEFKPLFDCVPSDRLEAVERMIAADVNCPRVCSLGRIFDVAAFIAGLGPVAEYDGQAPMLLEAMAGEVKASDIAELIPDASKYLNRAGSEIILDGTALLSDMARLRLQGWKTPRLARWFHETAVRLLVQAAVEARNTTGIDTIGLTGGCFMNRLLEKGVADALEKQGNFKVLTHSFTPPNDGCVSLGQAVIAGHLMRKSKSES
jgi:hydrogenase maturation protein HypF